MKLIKAIVRPNKVDEVKARATYVTDTNDNDGFAKAIERIIALE